MYKQPVVLVFPPKNLSGKALISSFGFGGMGLILPSWWFLHCIVSMGYWFPDGLVSSFRHWCSWSIATVSLTLSVLSMVVLPALSPLHGAAKDFMRCELKGSVLRICVCSTFVGHT